MGRGSVNERLKRDCKASSDRKLNDEFKTERLYMYSKLWIDLKVSRKRRYMALWSP